MRDSKACPSLRLQTPMASVTSDDLLVPTRRDSENCPQKPFIAEVSVERVDGALSVHGPQHFLQRGRRVLAHSGAALVGGMVRCFERRGAVHGAAVVPDDEVADLPFVTVDELGLCREFDQLAEQRLPLLDRHADNVLCVRGNVERAWPSSATGNARR
jgi:hypothetical protein